MNESSSRPIPAASAACFRDGQLLLARRARPPMLWSLPGGRIELGERAEETALRELREETGIEAELLGFAGHVDAVLRESNGETRRHFVILSFAARWRAGEIRVSPELAECRWIDPGELGGFQTTDGLADIVAAARRIAGS